MSVNKIGGGYGFTRCEVEDAELDEERLGCMLPPLPRPNLRAMRSEASAGISLVVCLVSVFVTLTIVFVNSSTETLKIPFIALILVEAFIALYCLGYLMLGDPGVVRRSLDSCLPVPPQVLEKLAAGFDPTGPHPLAGMDNVRDGDRTYCVRCCVWRDERTKVGRFGRLMGRGTTNARVHHCSVCQRCVRHFDHHCGVFGRCIAGKGLQGNMPYFTVVIIMGYAGAITTGAAGVAALSGVISLAAGSGLESG